MKSTVEPKNATSKKVYPYLAQSRDGRAIALITGQGAKMHYKALTGVIVHAEKQSYRLGDQYATLDEAYWLPFEGKIILES